MESGGKHTVRRARELALGWTRWFIPDEVRAEGESATTRAIVVVLLSPVAILATLVPTIAQLIESAPTPATVPLAIVVCLMFGLVPLVLRWTRSPTLAGAWLLFTAMLATCQVLWVQHGLDSVLVVWLLVIPIIAGFVLGGRWTVVFSLVSIVCLSLFWLLETHALLGVGNSLGRSDPEPLAFRWINLVTALAAMSVLAVIWERAANRARRERDELEAQIRRGQKLETVGMLAGGIAHDFNNILAAILGHASLLEGEVDDPEARRRIGAIVDSSRRAAVLVEQMLAYAGRSRTRSGSLDLPRLVREVVELVRPGLDKNTRLILDLDTPTPQLVADPVQIQQIAMNLVTNASEALESKPGRVWVGTATVDAAGRVLSRDATPDDFVMLEVRDEGCGIPPETLESIFDPFYTTKPSGHGLGLAAVLGIVRSHGGDIEVDSTLGQGTCFRVLLRCPDAEALAAAEPDDVPRPRIRLATINNPAKVPGTRRIVPRDPDGVGCILLVDDEPMIRELASEVLERCGHRVLLAGDGDDGLRVFEANGPDIDLVILDRTMPGRDGLELLAEMRRRRADLPAVISSGYADDDGSRKLRQLGVDAVLQKPWAPSDLVHVVSSLGLDGQSTQTPRRSDLPHSR